jgi:hypothetical protein
VLELNVTKQKLMTVEDLQTRYLLLKNCFRPKIHYWSASLFFNLSGTDPDETG